MDYLRPASIDLAEAGRLSRLLLTTPSLSPTDSAERTDGSPPLELPPTVVAPATPALPPSLGPSNSSPATPMTVAKELAFGAAPTAAQVGLQHPFCAIRTMAVRPQCRQPRVFCCCAATVQRPAAAGASRRELAWPESPRQPLEQPTFPSPPSPAAVIQRVHSAWFGGSPPAGQQQPEGAATELKPTGRDLRRALDILATPGKRQQEPAHRAVGRSRLLPAAAVTEALLPPPPLPEAVAF